MHFIRFLLICTIKNLILMLLSPKNTPLNELRHLREVRGTRTLFILGAGPSINELNSNDFLHIGECVSVGVNSVIVSDISVDFIAFESAGKQKAANEKTAKFFDLLEVKKNKGLNTVVFYYFSGNCMHGISTFLARRRSCKVVPYAGAYLKKLGNYSSIPANTWIIKTIRFFFRSRISLSQRCTVDRLIWLGAEAGFERIVLCGVDLESSQYFWSNVEATKKFNDQLTDDHTSLQYHDNVNALGGINIAREIVEKSSRVKVYRAASSQINFENFPVYKWGGSEFDAKTF